MPQGSEGASGQQGVGDPRRTGTRWRVSRPRGEPRSARGKTRHSPHDRILRPLVSHPPAGCPQYDRQGWRRTMDPVFARRSIRKYTDEPVPDDALRMLLAAAMVAPSAGDERPWHFVVIRSQRIRRIPRPRQPITHRRQQGLPVCRLRIQPFQHPFQQWAQRLLQLHNR